MIYTAGAFCLFMSVSLGISVIFTVIEYQYHNLQSCIPRRCVFEFTDLFRPPGPASAGRGGLYILLLHFIFFTRTYRWESAHPALVDTIPTVGPPHPLLKYRQTSDPCCPPFFYRGAKCAKIWPKIRPQSSSDRRIFEQGRFIGKPKQTCQGPMIALPSYQTWDGWVPPTPRTVGAMGTPKGKSGKFLIYPRL